VPPPRATSFSWKNKKDILTMRNEP